MRRRTGTTHTHINKIRITIKTQPLREGFKRHEPLACPSRESQRKRQDKQQSELRTSDEQKETEKKQKSGHTGRPRALRSLASAALRKKEKRERRTSQASAAEQTKLNKRSSRLIRPAWLAERSSPTRFRPKDDPRATKKKNRQKSEGKTPGGFAFFPPGRRCFAASFILMKDKEMG